jgi:predicted permease
LRRFKWISERYFETMGNPLLAGRDLTWRDIYSKAHVVLVTENFAREYWKEPAAALGKRIRSNPKDPWREIVGVVGNVRDDGADQKAPVLVYWPMMMKDFWGNNLFVQRTQAYAIRSSRTGALTFLKEVQAAVWAVNPNLPVANVRTLEEIHGRSMGRTSFTLVMLGIASGVALILGVVGIYGVISYSVSQRTREIGIRMALGAEQGEISRLFLGHGLLLTGIGVALGLGAAVALTRVMSALLFDVSPLDPVTYGAVSMGLIAAALLASYLPARRAAVVDPVEALRWQ